MAEQHVANAIDDHMRLAPAVVALEVSELIEICIAIDVAGKGPASVVRPAGIVDDEIARHRRVRIVVAGARHRHPQISGEIPFQVLLGQKAAQNFAAGQTGVAAEAACERGRQALQRRREVARTVHAAHQALGLLHWLADKTQGRRVECARPHGLYKKRRPEVVRFAVRAQRRLGAEAEHRAGKPDRDQTCVPLAATIGDLRRSAHCSHPKRGMRTILTNARAAKRCRSAEA